MRLYLRTVLLQEGATNITRTPKPYGLLRVYLRFITCWNQTCHCDELYWRHRPVTILVFIFCPPCLCL